MQQLEQRLATCPYCGEAIELALDASAGAQRYVEDCSVCCRPIEVEVSAAPDGDWQLAVYRDDD